jgi:trans-aconitate 2-methyltransferase
LQWLPAHEKLYPRLFAHLAPGGTLAVQTPDNEHEPAHVLMRKVAADGPWASRTASVRQLTRHAPAFYYALLKPLAAAVDVWRTTYHHPLADHQAVVEWFKGSGMRPYLDVLDASERAQFEERYLREVEAAYPALDDGTVLLPFPRLFVLATRSG